jgi:hypothetical protein
VEDEMKHQLKELLTTEWRFLLFKPVKPDMERLGYYYLGFGLVTAWLAGVGRYWDHPRALWWQYLGLGSVAYIIVLAAILWLILWPVRPRHWSYSSVLACVGMTSPPALLYAIPVERFVSMDTAAFLNMWFLGIVACWRVALWFLYVKRSGRLHWFKALSITLLPLVIIVTSLTILNLEHVVFDIMAGIRPENKSAGDGAYIVLLILTYFSMLAAPVLAICYVGTLISELNQRTRLKRDAQ